MNRAQKAAVIEDLQGSLNDAPLVILTDFVGSTVDDLDKIRKACEPAGATFRVVKNTLARRAVDGTALEGLADRFQGNVAVLISGEDPVAAAKLFTEQAKGNDKLSLKAGFFEGDVLEASGVVAVASLPSKEELQVQLLRVLQGGPQQVLTVLQAPARDLLYLLHNRANQLGDAS